MTTTTAQPVVYRLMHHYAEASNVHTPDLSPGVVVYEHWSTVTRTADGQTEVFDADRKEVASTIAFDDEWGSIPDHPELLDEDDAEEALRTHGFVLTGEQWQRQDDGQWRVEVDWYDPTP